MISYSSCSEIEQVSFKDFEWIIFIVFWQNYIPFIKLLYVEWLYLHSIKKVKILLWYVSKCVLYSTKLALEISLIAG